MNGLNVIFLSLLASTGLHARPSSESVMFNRLDRNGDERISVREFRGISRVFHRGLTATVTAIYNWYDENQNGSIDLGEWFDGRRGSGNLGVPVLTGAIYSNELDLNRDRIVSRNEFLRMVSLFVREDVARTWFSQQAASGNPVGPSTSLGGTGTVGGSVRDASGLGAPLAPGSSPGRMGGVSGGSLMIGGSSNVLNLSGTLPFSFNFGSGLTNSFGVSSTWQIHDPQSAIRWLESNDQTPRTGL